MIQVLVSRRSAKRLQFVSELFQKIRGFKALVGREGVSRSHLAPVKIGFNRDYRIMLSPDRPPRQSSELGGVTRNNVAIFNN